MSWVLAVAGIAAMTAAYERGDLDECARQGALAGPAAVERALGSPRLQLAAIAAAPAVEDAAELLPALARIAGGADRRAAIPAAKAARQIAIDLARRERPDDLAADDVDAWRGAYEAIARGKGDGEARIAALETANALEHSLDPAQLGFELGALLGDAEVDVALAAAAIACADRKADVAAAFPPDKLHALAKDHAAARDVEGCVK